MLKVEFISEHRKARIAPDPNFPEGKDLDISQGRKSCATKLPYPAECLGLFLVTCDVCGTNAAITTAGRLDDPRSVRLPCKLS